MKMGSRYVKGVTNDPFFKFNKFCPNCGDKVSNLVNTKYNIWYCDDEVKRCIEEHGKYLDGVEK